MIYAHLLLANLFNYPSELELIFMKVFFELTQCLMYILGQYQLSLALYGFLGRCTSAWSLTCSWGTCRRS
jgi:hypothetical protein